MDDFTTTTSKIHSGLPESPLQLSWNPMRVMLKRYNHRKYLDIMDESSGNKFITGSWAMPPKVNL